MKVLYGWGETYVSEDILMFRKLCFFSVVLLAINIIILVWCVIVHIRKKEEDIPIDDNNWNKDMDDLKITLKKFLENEQEKIEGLLGRNNTLNNENIYKAGFCFVTNEACYFIGRITQKGFLFSWKSVIQKRINMRKLKNIRKKMICPLCAELLLGYTISMTGYLITIWMLMIQKDIFDDVIYYECKITAGIVFMLVTICMILMVLPMIIYSIVILYTKRKTMLDIQFETITMRFPITQLGRQEINEFYNCVMRIQNNIKKEDHNKQVLKPEKNNDIVHSLNELSTLYEKNLISQEEFKKIKNDIINKI